MRTGTAGLVTTLNLELGASAQEADGIWFKIPPDARKTFEVALEGDGARAYVATVQSIMDKLNAFLGREDVSRDEKLAFMSHFLGHSPDADDEYANDKAYETLGPILSEVMAGGAALFEWDDVKLGFVQAAAASLTNAMPDLLRKYDVAVSEDTSQAYFNNMAIEKQEARRRRAAMNDLEFAADLAREDREYRASLRGELEKSAERYRSAALDGAA